MTASTRVVGSASETGITSGDGVGSDATVESSSVGGSTMGGTGVGAISAARASAGTVSSRFGCSSRQGRRLTVGPSVFLSGPTSPVRGRPDVISAGMCISGPCPDSPEWVSRQGASIRA